MTFKKPFSSLYIACIQMDIQLGKIRANINHAEKLITKAISRGAQIIVLPELFTTGYDLAHSRNLAQTLNGETVQWMMNLSKNNNIFLMGSIIEKGDDLPYNTFIIVTPEGEINTYRKIHLFAPMGEADAFSAGNELLIIEIAGWKVGVATCYDLRFSDMFMHYSKEEIDLLIICAEWPITRISHWNTLLLARAIESQFFVVACNRVGKDASNEFGGNSQIIMPTGEIISMASSTEEIIVGSLNHDNLNEARNKFSISYDRNRFKYDF